MGSSRKFFAAVVLAFFACSVNAQNNVWTWMKGSSTANSTGSYGTMGVASPANNPPARYEPAEWTDNQGRFWMYGGFEFVGNNTYADLWMYNPATNMWTWMNGSNTSNIMPVYGTQGVPAPGNTPGSRKYAMATWTDLQGNLWLFGGFTPSGIGNDLWKYDMTLNEWVWMKGQNTAFPAGSYGTIGVPNSTNEPSYRTETSATWVDNNGDLWFFGGQGNGNFNDLWRYNIATNTWTWMNGSQFGFAAGNWGTMGVASPTNVPSGRMVYASWKDLAGNFWLFGGNDSSFFSGGGSHNDLWKYDPVANMWTWMNGTNINNDPGSYGAQCVPSATNTPPSRMECRTRWTDDCGNLWLFGGAINPGGTGGFNDLWKYNVQTNEWTWVSGANTWNQNAVYGTQTVPNAANHPAWRMGSVGWKNNQGLWLFGGANSNTNFFNDVWKYTPDKPTAAFTGTPTSGCAPLTVQFTDQSLPNCTDINTWSWNFGDPASGVNNVSSLQDPSHVFNAQGSYTVTLVVTSCLGLSDSATLTINANTGLNLSATTSPATCGNPNGSATVSISNGTGPFTYAWSSGGNAATENNLAAGNYTCTVTDANGCQGTQTVSIANNSGLNIAVASQNDVSCNGGTNGTATINPSGGTGPYTFSWAPSGGNNATANNLPAGMYTVTVTDQASCSSTQTVAITEPPVITLSLTAVPATCGNSNGSADVNAGGGAGGFLYSWQPSGGNASSATNLAAGNYTVTVTDANGCQSTDSVQVNGSGTMSSSLSAQTDVLCNGGTNGSATVNASGGSGTYSYNWLPSGGTSATANNLSAGTYTVTISDTGGCTNTVNVTITEPPVISLTTSGNVAICTGSNATLLASATGGAGNFSYTWNPGAIVSNSVTVAPNSTATYTVNAVDANGCSSSDSLTVTVNQPVTMSVSGSTLICAGQTTSVSASASNSGPYVWQPGNLSGSSVSVSPAVTTTYTVSVWDVCQNVFVTDSVTVAVENVMSQFVQTPSQGCGPLLVGFTDQSFVNSGTITGWSWNFGDGDTSSVQNPVHTFSIPGTYTVTLSVTTSNGCSQSAAGSQVVDVWPSPLAGFSVYNIPVTTLDPTADFVDQSVGAVTWQWDFGDGNTGTLQNPSHQYPADTGSYFITLVVSNSYGCVDTATGELNVLDDFTFYVPNAFTPNGDGLDELFTGYGTGIEKFHMMVFDRWGNLFYQTDDISQGWDGTYKGKKVQEDVYVYKIDITDIFLKDHHYIGHVSVVR
ncbi:MAG TPA: PKD domain-containing protein [Bacteroidia bacterium]|nr:PKD domain-containing protein [Bacteroidia bacterium]